MSNAEALSHFLRKQVSSEMVQYLVDTTSTLIKTSEEQHSDSLYPTPPGSPCKLSTPEPVISLFKFIANLIHHTNVQTPTLMASLVYLNRLKKILPSTVYGIATTRHRIFLGCLILAAKTLNDSSPVNKHWSKATDGLLTTVEINTIERELLEYLRWDLTIREEDLYNSLGFFIIPIKAKLKRKTEAQVLQRQNFYISSAMNSTSTRLSTIIQNTPSLSTPSPSPRGLPPSSRLPYSTSQASVQSSVPSLMSASSSRSTLASATSMASLDRYVSNESHSRHLRVKNINTLPTHSEEEAGYVKKYHSQRISLNSNRASVAPVVQIV
ncbi:hypothetical protein WICPIJ_006823 [Wickerhamomyces pijperi]|uniref:Cyclin N-terminal domain-containing protein n=1 Tax=Wickerhamomyces pijperi TaxID=599730 RepID=A0A9P8Q101_WICPI|nr:hypothetical protein WICPIJ_006823 [Wickerhamomyces pijperi]